MNDCHVRYYLMIWVFSLGFSVLMASLTSMVLVAKWKPDLSYPGDFEKHIGEKCVCHG